MHKVVSFRSKAGGTAGLVRACAAARARVTGTPTDPGTLLSVMPYSLMSTDIL